MTIFSILIVSLLAKITSADPDFLWGSATASYQVEGAVHEDGRGDTVWDIFSHTPGKVANGDTGDVADDSYHRYQEDIDILKNMGLNSYRFSIAWSRIFPDGDGEINQAGVDHYNKVIDALVKADIVPFATLFHWDTPLALEARYGGWLSPEIEQSFVKYADACFAAFGDRVKNWLTLNEPMTVALVGYSAGVHAPGRCSDRTLCAQGNSTTEPYIVAHNMLNSHAAVVQLYRAKYQQAQGGKIGITLNTDFGYPFKASSPEDVAAANRYVEFQAGWYADPVFFGHYPESMVQLVGDRLPSFTPEQAARIKGSWDFYGLNHYSSNFVQAKDVTGPSGGWDDDQQSSVGKVGPDGNLNGAQAASPWLTVVPEGFYEVLTWVSKRYGNPPIYVTENGCDVPGESQMAMADALEDDFRVFFYSSYLANMQRARSEGVNVRGYFAWSLLDNFEWADGYNYRFGLNYVDFNDNMKRYAKKSSKWLTEYIKSPAAQGKTHTQ